jgi:hypothetical protein
MKQATEPPKKTPRRVKTSIDNLIKQREKALSVRYNANLEIEQYNAALAALGVTE